MRRPPWNSSLAACLALSCMLAVAYGPKSAAQEKSEKKSTAPAAGPALGGNPRSPGPGSSAAGQRDASQLIAAIDAARKGYRQTSPQQVADAKARLLDALTALDGWLSSSSEAPAWKSYLKWDQLQQQLASGAKPDPAQLREVLKQYRDKYAGLELTWFSNVRYWLKAYADTVEAAAASTPERFRNDLDAIAGILKGYQQGGPLASKDLGAVIARIQHAGQAPDLVARLRRRFSRPNAVVLASNRLITSGIARQVDETMPLRDNIMGTFITGTGRTIGSVTGQLLDDPHHASVLTSLSGTTWSSTVGYNGPAIICASGQTAISGQKLLYFDADGVHSLPASASAETSSTVTGVGSRHGGLIGRIVERAAWKRIPERKPASDRVATEHARVKVANQMDAQADALVERANRAYDEKLRVPMLRQDAFPRQLALASNPAGVRITATASSDELLGAPDDPPELTKHGELYLRLHESLANNLAAQMLGGRTITRAEVEEGAIDTFGVLPESMKRDQEEDNAAWAIEFAEEDPVTLAFDNNEASITIRGHRYRSGTRVFMAMTVSARYKLVATPQGMRADRQGPLVIFPPALGPGKPMGVREKVVEQMLRKRFNRIFEEQVVFHGLKLPGNWLKLGPLVAHNFKTESGWLLVAWEEGEAKQREVNSGK